MTPVREGRTLILCIKVNKRDDAEFILLYISEANISAVSVYNGIQNSE